MATTIRDLDTPALVLDAPRFRRNLETLERRVRAAGKRARPHAKTHKCSRIAAEQLRAGAVGVCAAKPSEALALLEAGVEPVLVTGPVVRPSMLERLALEASRGRALALVVDSIQGAERLDAACGRAGARMHVVVDLDPGLGRTGVRPDEAALFAGRLSGLTHLDLVGVQAYLGNAQHLQTFDERRSASLRALFVAQEVFRDLGRAGHRMEILTGGGTGTFDIDTEVPDLTDIQAGSYAVMDTQYLTVGSREDPARFGTFEPALQVLSTVLSAPVPGQVTVDAGLKTIYRDTPAPWVVDPGGGALVYDWFGDEYGRVAGPPARLPRIGDLVRIVPSHCDPTVNLFDHIHVVEGDTVVDRWTVDLRGRSQ